MDNVYVRHGSYHIDLGRIDGKRRSKKLCRTAEGERSLYAAMAKHTTPKATTVNDMLDRFLGPGIADLAPRTQKDYCNYANRQLRPVFGDMAPEDVQPTHIAQYLEKRKATARVSANKEIACLSSAFEYAQRIGLCNGNPCRSVRRNKTTPRTRYVRDDEFRAAIDVAPEHLQDLMAGMYLMGLRPSEAYELRGSAIDLNCIRFEESKTGKVKEIAWSEALRYFVDRANNRHPQSPFVFTNSLGDKWTEGAANSALQRVRTHIDGPSFTLQDLRAKGESDHETGMGLMALYKRAHRVTPVH